MFHALSAHNRLSTGFGCAASGHTMCQLFVHHNHVQKVLGEQHSGHRMCPQRANPKPFEHTTGCGGILHGMVSSAKISYSKIIWLYVMGISFLRVDLKQTFDKRLVSEQGCILIHIKADNEKTTSVSISVSQGGMITSPRNTGSLQYPDSTECIWELRTDPGYHTEVN